MLAPTISSLYSFSKYDFWGLYPQKWLFFTLTNTFWMKIWHTLHSPNGLKFLKQVNELVPLLFGQFGKFHLIFSPNKLSLCYQLRGLKFFKISSMHCGNMALRQTTKLSCNVQYHITLQPVKFHANIWHSLATMPKKNKISLFSSS